MNRSGGAVNRALASTPLARLRQGLEWRRKLTISGCNAIRERIANEIDGGESFFCIDSKPIEVCRIARSSRCRLGKSDYDTAPSFGFCASQNTYLQYVNYLLGRHLGHVKYALD